MNQTRTADWDDSFTSQMGRIAGHAILKLLGRIFRTPFTSMGVMVLTVGTVMAGANALYMQPKHHPAPMLMERAAVIAPKVEPVPQVKQVMPEVAGDLGNAAAVSPAPDPLMEATRLSVERAHAGTPEAIGNADVAALQQKLLEMKLFDGKVDGYYGPQTAKAIRAFELRAGMKPKGALSPEVLDAVAKARIEAPKSSKRDTPIVTPATRASMQKSATITKPVVAKVTAEPDAIGKLVMETAVVPAPAPEPALLKLSSVTTPSVDRELILTVQRGLARLGFLNSEMNGTYDDATARAIREFENYNSYRVTGKMAPELVDMLMAAGAID